MLALAVGWLHIDSTAGMRTVEVVDQTANGWQVPCVGIRQVDIEALAIACAADDLEVFAGSRQLGWMLTPKSHEALLRLVAEIESREVQLSATDGVTYNPCFGDSPSHTLSR